ncbi:MAG: hypothetical protein WC269_01825 [Candidatus Gracilibacteria bacterium]|jgi:hypothetical protein
MAEKEPKIIVERSKQTSHKGLAQGVISRSVQLMREDDQHFRSADLREALGGADILGRHFEQISDEARKIISGVQLKLNDYLAMLGIGLKSVEAHPLTKNWLGMIKDVQLFSEGNEDAYPTIGLRPQINHRDSKIVLFGPKAGEGLISLSDRLSAKRFTPEDLKDDSVQSVGHVSRGEYIAAKRGEFIGVPLNIVDPLKFANAGLQYAELDREHGRDSKDEAQQMYLCIYLVRQAIQDLLRNGKSTKNEFLLRKFGLAA